MSTKLTAIHIPHSEAEEFRIALERALERAEETMYRYADGRPIFLDVIYSTSTWQTLGTAELPCEHYSAIVLFKEWVPD